MNGIVAYGAYLPYFRTGTFDRANTARILHPSALAAPLGPADLRRYLDAYLAVLLAA